MKPTHHVSYETPQVFDGFLASPRTSLCADWRVGRRSCFMTDWVWDVDRCGQMWRCVGLSGRRVGGVDGWRQGAALPPRHETLCVANHSGARRNTCLTRDRARAEPQGVPRPCARKREEGPTDHWAPEHRCRRVCGLTHRLFDPTQTQDMPVKNTT